MEENTMHQEREGMLPLMPLMNCAFTPGRCREAIEAMPDGRQRAIAEAEYAYFSGDAERALTGTLRFMGDSDPAARLSACLIYAYAGLAAGEIGHVRRVLDEVQSGLTADGTAGPALRAAAAFAASAASVLLHLPLRIELPAPEDYLPLLPAGLRAFALYIQAHGLYLRGAYEHSLGLVQGALAMGAEAYPIPAIYLHLVAVMDLMSLRRQEEARAHLLAAWALAQPDDLIEPFGEHHGLVGGMLEAVLKPAYPADFKRIIEITYRFSAGWRRVHNPETGHDVADNLTTTEFAIAMLAARGWTNPEIAAHLSVSRDTVKRHVSSALHKLHVTKRSELRQYMLR